MGSQHAMWMDWSDPSKLGSMSLRQFRILFPVFHTIARSLKIFKVWLHKFYDLSESIGSGIWWSSYDLYMIISDLWSSIYQDIYMIFIWSLSTSCCWFPFPLAQAVRVVEAVCSQDQARGSWQCSAFAPLVCRGADERSRSPRWQVCVCAVCDVCDVRIDIVLKMWDNVR